MKRRLLPIGAVFALALVISMVNAASANVSLKNGNFFIGYTDVIFPGGFEPKIERVYNSKTPFKGMFGWGWGNEYETYLRVLGDGSVMFHEYGGGAEVAFEPAELSEADIAQAIEKLVDGAQKSGARKPGQLPAYRDSLIRDATFRSDQWVELVNKKAVAARQLPVGARLTANRFSYQVVQRTDSGYRRDFDNGRTESFNDIGRLIRVTDKNNNFLDLSYVNDTVLAAIRDNFGREMRLFINARGLVDSITATKKNTTRYTYNSIGELIKSFDSDSNVYTFGYDAAGRHNLTRIGYSDSTTLEIEYHPMAKHENVKSVRDRDSTLTMYEYDLRQDDGFVGVKVTVIGLSKDTISTSEYQYYEQRRGDGSVWTTRMLTVIDGDSTDTHYNECCASPVLIVRGSDSTKFEYDDFGHVTFKQTPSEVTRLTYDKALGKVIRSSTRARRGKDKEEWSEFRYDARGNLIQAWNSDAKRVDLRYDTNGRISRMSEKNAYIEFSYDANSKPIEIKHSKLGSITVTYTESGEIKNVESPQGREVSLKVTSAFQNLLDIIRPAGVSLSF